MSTSLDCRSEDIRVLPIVIAELELGNIERHVFTADLVKRTDDSPLDDGPKAFNGLSVDRTNDVLAPSMIDDAARVFLVKVCSPATDQCKAG
jgi:hypothetical protein